MDITPFLEQFTSVILLPAISDLHARGSSRAFTMAASWSSNRWSGSASSISRKLTAARWPTARLRRLSSIPCLSWAGWSYRSTPPGRRAAGGGQQGRCTVAPLAGGAYQGGQNGQPLPGAGVHAGLAAPLGFAPADFLVADGAGRDPLGPAGRVLDCPVSQVQVDGPHWGEALAVAEPLGGRRRLLPGRGGDGGCLGLQPLFPGAGHVGGQVQAVDAGMVMFDVGPEHPGQVVGQGFQAGVVEGWLAFRR